MTERERERETRRDRELTRDQQPRVQCQYSRSTAQDHKYGKEKHSKGHSIEQGHGSGGQAQYDTFIHTIHRDRERLRHLHHHHHHHHYHSS